MLSGSVRFGHHCFGGEGSGEVRIWERVTCGFWRKTQNLPPFFLSPYSAKRENLPPLILVILQGSLFMEAVMVQRPLGGGPSAISAPLVLVAFLHTFHTK